MPEPAVLLFQMRASGRGLAMLRTLGKVSALLRTARSIEPLQMRVKLYWTSMDYRFGMANIFPGVDVANCAQSAISSRRFSRKVVRR